MASITDISDITPGSAIPVSDLARITGGGIGGGTGSNGCVRDLDITAYNARCMPMQLWTDKAASCCADVGGQAECGSNRCFLHSDKVEDSKKCFKGDYVCLSPAARISPKFLLVGLAIAAVVGLS